MFAGRVVANIMQDNLNVTGLAGAAEPSRFLAVSAIVLSSGSLLAIVASAIPRLMVNLCI